MSGRRNLQSQRKVIVFQGRGIRVTAEPRNSPSSLRFLQLGLYRTTWTIILLTWDMLIAYKQAIELGHNPLSQLHHASQLRPTSHTLCSLPNTRRSEVTLQPHWAFPLQLLGKPLPRSSLKPIYLGNSMTTATLISCSPFKDLACYEDSNLSQRSMRRLTHKPRSRRRCP